MGLLGHISADVFNIFLGEAADLLGQWDEACCAIEKGEDTREALLWLMRTAQNLRRASRGVGLEEFAHALASTEELIRELLKADARPQRNIIDTFSLAHATLCRWLVGVRSDPNYVEDMTTLNDAIRICRSAFNRSMAEVRPGMTQFSGQQASIQSESLQRAATAYEQNVTGGFPIERVEGLIDLVGQINSHHQTLASLAGPTHPLPRDYRRALETLLLQSRELQDCAVGLRLCKMSKLVERLEDYILDLAEERGVALQFDADGHDVELDVSLIEGLWRPLQLLVDTAFEYGFDHPEERVKVGKLPTLVVKLSAAFESGLVTICLEDDGRGVGDTESVNSASESSLQLEKVRGLLSGVSGILKIQSQKDRKTLFSVTLPQSLRLMNVVVGEAMGQSYALPGHAIEEIIEPGKFHTHTIRGDKQFIEYNSKIYPFVMLPELLERATPQPRTRVQASVAIESGHVILLSCGREPIAIGVEKITDKNRFVIQPLPPHLQNIRGLSGFLVPGFGDPVLVVDLVEITDAFWAPRAERNVA